MKLALPATFTLTAVLAVSGCSQSKDPYSDTCKSIAATLAGAKSIAWEAPEKKVVDGEYLRVNLFSPQTTASCFFKAQETGNETEVPMQGDFEDSPYRMILNGRQIADADLIKATVIGMSANTKKATLEGLKNARGKAETAVQKTQEAAEAAQKKLRDMQQGK